MTRPSVVVYLSMLNMIIDHSTNIADIRWSTLERHKMLRAGLIEKINENTYLAIKGAEWD